MRGETSPDGRLGMGMVGCGNSAQERSMKQYLQLQIKQALPGRHRAFFVELSTNRHSTRL